tara:strand:- start:1564 stop:1803 length:240 start_codon:yes stop_codon:yes gene_type:complete
MWDREPVEQGDAKQQFYRRQQGRKGEDAEDSPEEMCAEGCFESTLEAINPQTREVLYPRAKMTWNRLNARGPSTLRGRV